MNKTHSALEDEKQGREGNAFPQKGCNSKTSDYDLDLFPDRLKGRLVVKFKTSSFLYEDPTRVPLPFLSCFTN